MKHNFIKLFISTIILFVLSACAPTTSYQSIKNTRLSSSFSVQDQINLVNQLSNNLVNSDSIKDALNGKRPRLLIDKIKNTTSEHINTNSITDTLQTTILQKRLFRIISRDNLNILAQEQKLNNAGLTDTQRATKLGKLWGVQYVLYGYLNSIVNYASGHKNTFYKLTLFLQNIESGEVVWVGEASVNKTTS